MKTKLLLLPLFLILFSCEIEGELTKDKIESTIDPVTSITVTQGQFASTAGIKVSGAAKIVQDGTQFKVVLDNFSISSGPDLKVYLSKTNTPSDFVNLGNLNPTMVYSVPQNIEIKDYKFVLIHCQQYNHLFAVAELIKN
jgi:hypothetical protein